MSDSALTRAVLVANQMGIHLRAALLIANTARQFQATVWIVKDNARVEATDVLQILSLGAAAGQELRLEAAGDDAPQALEAVARLFADRFGED